jgi:hypothetical protein
MCITTIAVPFIGSHIGPARRPRVQSGIVERVRYPVTGCPSHVRLDQIGRCSLSDGPELGCRRKKKGRELIPARRARSKNGVETRSLAESSGAKAIDALQVQLFAKALVGLGLTQYFPLVPDRRRNT